MESRLKLYILILIIIFINRICFAEGENNSSLEIEEIPAVLKLKNVGSLELLLLKQNDKIYYPIGQLFDFLSIKIEINKERDIISGFYLDKKFLYKIDISENMLGEYNSKKYTLKPDYFIVKGNEIYLIDEVYKDIFGLDLKFDLRKLDVKLKSRDQVPVISRYRSKKNREKNLISKALQIESYAEEYEYKLFNGSTFDWRINALASKERLPKYRYVFGSGSRILGSDLQLTVKGIIHQPIKERDINGFLRVPFFGKNYLGQITAGDLTSLSPNSIGRVRGIEVTNRPAKRRLVQATDELKINVNGSEELELYQSGGLSSYHSAQDGREYSVNIDLPYGISDYEFRALDRWGGVDRYLYRYNIPYSMLPYGEFQYSVKAGNLRYRKKEKYGNVLFEYGATNLITLGAEIQYLNSHYKTKIFPAALATVRLTKGLTSEFSFSPFLRSVSKINAVFPSEAFLNLSYEFFARNSPLNYGNLNNQASFSLRLPLKVSRGMNPFGFYYDMSGIYSESDNYKLYTITSQLSAYGSGFQYSMGTIYSKNIFSSPLSSQSEYWSANANIAVSLPADVVFQVSTNYNHSIKKVGTVGLNITKAVQNFFVSVSYERVLQPNITIANLNISYYLPFVRLLNNVNRVQSKMSYNQTLVGSVITSGNLKNYYFEKRQMLGRGILEFKPFYDSNNNGIKEKEENYIKNIRMNISSKIRGSFSSKTKEGLIVNYPQPYQNYTAEIPHQTLENPSLVAKYHFISTIAEPNAYKIIDIPFVDGGIVNGNVMLLLGDRKEPVGGITIVIEELVENTKTTGYKNKTFTLSSGEFVFLNIPPGKYRVTLLDTELKEAGYVSIISEHLIEVLSQPEGDIIENIDFGLIKIE